jgi:hypothetical protein
MDRIELGVAIKDFFVQAEATPSRTHPSFDQALDQIGKEVTKGVGFRSSQAG